MSTNVPTATEFVPRDEDEVNDARRLMSTADGGVEELVTEPYDEKVLNHVYICDECGQSESLETDMAFHLRTQHDGDVKRQRADARNINRDARIQ